MHACKHAHTPAEAHDRHASASVCIFTSCASSVRKISAKQRSSGSQHDQQQKLRCQRSMVCEDGASTTQAKNSDGVKGIEPWHTPVTSSAAASLRIHSAFHWPSGRSLPCLLFDYTPRKLGDFMTFPTPSNSGSHSGHSCRRIVGTPAGCPITFRLPKFRLP